MAKKILAVDDSKTMRDMISFALSQAGHEMREAENGVEALRMLETFTPDLIITDINMPEMDGFTLLEALRAKVAFKFTPILILTTESDAQNKERGKALGATGWIVKPFNPEKLQQIVMKVCP